MISKDKIASNYKKFVERGLQYEVLTDGLIEELGTDLISSPCTTSNEMFGAFEGGLVDYILNVTKHAVLLNEKLSENKKVDKSTLIRVCLIHQIGKITMFVEQTDKWRREKLNELYTFNNDVLPMTVSERTISFLMKHQIKLNEHEIYAINNYNSDFIKKDFTHEGVKISAILRVANLIATIEEK